MVTYKPGNFLYCIVVKFETPHDLSRGLLADKGMPFEMIASFFICCFNKRFSHIMEEHGQAEYLVALYILQRMERVLRHIIPAACH